MVNTNKGQRTKRPDGRIKSAQKLARDAKTQAKAETVQDLKVTRVQKNQRGKRDFNVEAMPLRIINKDSSEKKFLKSLRKKLKSLEALVKLQEQGKDLTEQQLEKLDGVDDVIEQFASISGIVAEQENGIRGGRSPTFSTRKSVYPIADKEEEEGYYNAEQEESDSEED